MKSMGNMTVAVTVAAMLLVLCGGSAFANGPNGAQGTTPRMYPASAFPLTYKIDQGGLGSINNTSATAITNYAFGVWDTLPTASLSFSNGGYLDHNVTSSSDPLISGANQWTDGVNPIVFDSSGAILDDIYGTGTSTMLYAVALSQYTGLNYLEGYVILNGKLTGNGGDSVQNLYRATVTHEVGHFLGLSHTQNGVHADFATMYPLILSARQMTLQPDDAASISVLYPAAGYMSTVGSISGTVKPLSGSDSLYSGMMVIAVDSASGRSYSTVVDYYSGGGAGFSNPPARTGSYTFSGLPAGNYFVQIQPIKSDFTGASRIASYQNATPSISSKFLREWYNGVNESGDMLKDNLDEKTGVAVTAGGSVTGINFINDLNAISRVSSSNLAADKPYPLYLAPNQGSGADSATRYAMRFTAPVNGSLVSVRFQLGSGSILPVGGRLTVAVYTSITGSWAGIPGTILGSVTVPIACLSADQDNEVFLRSLGTGINFNKSTDFHIVFLIDAGIPRFWFDNGSSTENRSSYYTAANGWRNFPDNPASRLPGITMKTSIGYSAQPYTPPAIGLSAASLDFGNVRPGAVFDQSVTLTNNGGDLLNVSATSLTGANAAEFQIVSGGGAFTMAAGTNRVITLRFAPTTLGLKVASLSLADNAAGTPHSVALTGTGTQGLSNPIVAAYDFGQKKIGSTTNATVALLHNTGNDTLRISSAALSGPDAGSALVITSGAATVPPDSVYHAGLRFRPTELRTYNATLTLVHDDQGSSPQTFVISGEGNSGVLDLSESAVDFGQVLVNTRGDRSIVLRNTGNTKLTISNLQITGKDSLRFTATNQALPFTIPQDDSAYIQLRFQPVQSGAQGAVLDVTSDVGNQQVQLKGTGTEGQLWVSVSSMDFGDVKQGDTKVDSFQISNSGLAPLTGVTLSMGGTNSAAFTPDLSGSITLAPGETRAVHMTLQPQTVLGQLTATASVNGGAVTIPVTIKANITQGTGGVAAAQPLIAGGLQMQLGVVEPNPAAREGGLLVTCSIEGVGRAVASITVTDMRGSTVARAFDGYLVGTGVRATRQFAVNLKGLAAGQYFVVLESGGKSVTEKFVITR